MARESAQRAGSAAKPQADRTAAGQAAIQLNDGRVAVAGLAGGVNHHWIRDGWQRIGGLDEEGRGAVDLEGNRVQSGIGVGRQERLLERTGAAGSRVRHQNRRARARLGNGQGEQGHPESGWPNQIFRGLGCQQLGFGPTT